MDFFKDSDWASAFEVAVRDGVYAVKTDEPVALSMDDVASVVASSEGENDERDWLAVFALKDGRYAFLWAGCDYTGWG
jgi:tellurite resistance protein